MIRSHKLSATAAAVIVLAALCVLASGASGVIIRAGNLLITLEGRLSPSHLPKAKMTPIGLSLGGAINTVDGSHPPAMHTASFEFDKDGLVNTAGLPTCTAAKITSTTTAVARKACRDALVGEGKATAEVAFPEQAPFKASGTMLVFNGPTKGRTTTFLLHVYAYVPAPTAFIIPAVVTREHHGRYGTKVMVDVPQIAGGYGSVVSYSVTVHRSWRYKGKEQSLLMARCSHGVLAAHGDFRFADGSSLSGTLEKRC